MEPPSQLKSWSQAFEDHSIVQTRAIEKQLRSDVGLNKQKLRNLVGGSYRDLLATAEQIVTLDAKTAKVEGQISELGRNCKPKQYGSPKDSVPKHSNVAQLSLLHRCSSCIATCLKTDQIILVAKLLAVARLLHTSLSKQEHPPKILESLLDQLSRSRRRLLRRIDRRLDDVEIEQDELTAIICAFCLATSSSCNDSIHHFQHRRLGQIRHSAQGTHGDHRHTTKTLKYYIHSLRSTKLLLGQDVPRALRKLQQTAILQDSDVLKLEQLCLSSLRTLMPSEILIFTPYIKKSELSEKDAQALLEKWSAEAFESVQSQLVVHLKTLDDTSAAFQLRQDLFSSWLEFCFSTPAQKGIFESLRTVLNQHIELQLSKQVSGLADIASHLLIPPKDVEITSTGDTISASIWSPSLATSSLNNGAAPFLTSLRTSALGSSPSLVTISSSLSTWCASISSLHQSISALTKIRWQDIVEEPDESDEDKAKLIVRHLSVNDPQSFSKHLESSLKKSLADFQDKISEAANTTTSLTATLHLLRGIREAHLQLRAALPDADITHLESSVPALYVVLADEVVKRLAAAMETPSPAATTPPPRKETPRDLLPTGLPSPTAFKTLQTLCRVMGAVGGTDTWTRAATAGVRRAVAAWIWGAREGAGEEARARYVRTAFDEVYVKTALGADVDGEAEEEVKKTATEYWGRTRLLFGVLDC